MPNSSRQGRLSEEVTNDTFDTKINSFTWYKQEGFDKFDKDYFDSLQNLEALNGSYDLENK